MSSEATNSWSKHLHDLKNTIIQIVFFWGLASIVCFFFSQNIFEILLQPLDSTPLSGKELILLTPLDGFVAQMKVIFIGGLIFSLPFIMYTIWKFVSPGLKNSERQFISKYVFVVLTIVYVSIIYGFFWMLPFSLNFLLSLNPAGTTITLTLLDYLNFLVSLLLGVVILFQLPVLVFSLLVSKLIKSEFIESRRREIYIVLLIIIAIVTPPDIFTLFIMAVPVLGLFEIAILLAKALIRKGLGLR
jgi:sec-independent protein translocase protein TatC